MISLNFLYVFYGAIEPAIIYERHSLKIMALNPLILFQMK